MSTIFELEDIVEALVTAQGLTEGKLYTVIDIEKRPTPFGTFVAYTLEDAQKNRFNVSNGHVILKEVRPSGIKNKELTKINARAEKQEQIVRALIGDYWVHHFENYNVVALLPFRDVSPKEIREKLKLAGVKNIAAGYMTTGAYPHQAVYIKTDL